MRVDIRLVPSRSRSHTNILIPASIFVRRNYEPRQWNVDILCMNLGMFVFHRSYTTMLWPYKFMLWSLQHLSIILVILRSYKILLMNVCRHANWIYRTQPVNTILSPPVRYDQRKFSTHMFNHNSKLFAMVIALRAYTCYICLLKSKQSEFAFALRTYICCHCHCLAPLPLPQKN